MTIYDNGDIEFEVTTLEQIGRTVAAILSHPEETANQYVYVHSFTTTQNKIIAGLERHGDMKWTTSIASRDLCARAAQIQVSSAAPGDSNWIMGHMALITLIMMNNWKVNEYSKQPGKLWNKRLGLPEEDWDEMMKELVKCEPQTFAPRQGP
jgi:hypothetical protein